MPLNEETLKAVDELEEQLIKTEILPAMSKDIEPMLSQIQRELVLVVEYKPGTPISVALSRKTNITELIDAKKLELDPQAQHTEGKKAPKTKVSPKTGLCIYLPDGSFIQKKKASDTMVEAVRMAGAMRVRELNMICAHVPLVSNTKDKKYAANQHEVEPGLYVITQSSTKEKKRQLEQISSRLKLNWHIVIIDRDGAPIPEDKPKKRSRK